MPEVTAESLAKMQLEISSASATAKQEIIEAIDEISQQIEAVSKGLKKTDATLEKELLRIHTSLNALAQSSRKTTAKLAWTIEASVRQALAEAHGNQWVQSRNIESAGDVIEYIATIATDMDLDRKWVERAKSMIMDEMQKKGTILATFHLLQTYYLKSKYDSWTKIRTQMKDDPLVDEHDRIIPLSFAKAIGNAPVYHKNLFKKLHPMALRAKALNKLHPNFPDCFLNEEFLNTEFSLMCLGVLSQPLWVQSEEVPPHKLEYDCQGRIVATNTGLDITGAEIKSSFEVLEEATNQLNARFELLMPVLSILFPSFKSSTIRCFGQACAPYLSGDKPP